MKHKEAVSAPFQVDLDGGEGEGGGQIVRSALTLSMLTGRPFRIQRIRAGRSRPGLLRQHLTAVQAAAAVCGAHVTGASVGSTELEFQPGPLQGGDWTLAIGTAGSTTLVLQTLLPALCLGPAPSRVEVSGGTHNSSAPPADFLLRSWLPLLRRMGARIELQLHRHGFYPAGGGVLEARIEPVSTLQVLHLDERGPLQQLEAEAIVAGVPHGVAERELAVVRARWPDVESRVRSLPAREGPGHALLLGARHDGVHEVFMALGERGVAAERVAEDAVRQLDAWLASSAAVGEHLADQLLLPMALAGEGSFTTPVISSHLRTNAAVISRFLPVRIDLAEGVGLCRVTVHPSA